MVQSAQPRLRNHRRVCLRLALDRSALRRVLSQGVVNSVSMVIAHVLPKQTEKMTLVPSNDMIQELTAAASYPTFGSSILQGARTLVRFAVKPVACKNVVTESSNFASRSKIT